MDFTITNLATFRRHLASAAKVAPKNSPNPVRACVKIRTGESTVVMDATDNEVSIQLTCGGVTVTEPGQVAVPAAKLSEIVGKLPDGPVSFRVESDKLLIRAGKSKYEMATQPPHLFPTFRGLDLPTLFKVDSAELSRAISRTLPVGRTDRESSHKVPALHLAWVADTATLVGFDGGRAVRQTFTIEPTDQAGVSEALVPVQALSDAAPLLKAASGVVEVAADRSTLVLHFADAVFASRTAEGRYISWGSIPSVEIAHTVKMPASMLFTPVDQASVFLSDETRRVNLTLSPGLVTFASAAKENGNAAIELDVPGLDADDYQISFDHRYLVDALTPLGDEEVEVEFPAKPALVNFKSLNYEHRVAPILT